MRVSPPPKHMRSHCLMEGPAHSCPGHVPRPVFSQPPPLCPLLPHSRSSCCGPASSRGHPPCRIVPRVPESLSGVSLCPRGCYCSLSLDPCSTQAAECVAAACWVHRAPTPLPTSQGLLHHELHGTGFDSSAAAQTVPTPNQVWPPSPVPGREELVTGHPAHLQDFLLVRPPSPRDSAWTQAEDPMEMGLGSGKASFPGPWPGPCGGAPLPLTPWPGQQVPGHPLGLQSGLRAPEVPGAGMGAQSWGEAQLRAAGLQEAGAGAGAFEGDWLYCFLVGSAGGGGTESIPEWGREPEWVPLGEGPVAAGGGVGRPGSIQGRLRAHCHWPTTKRRWENQEGASLGQTPPPASAWGHPWVQARWRSGGEVLPVKSAWEGGGPCRALFPVPPFLCRSPAGRWAGGREYPLAKRWRAGRLCGKAD